MTGLFTLPIHFLLLISLCVILHLPFIFLHFLNVFRMSLSFVFSAGVHISFALLNYTTYVREWLVQE